ncbi:MAG TPA: TonB-dependent receptor plug domain-containing protein [Opitutaceae bacterium]|jgi:outer membrane receptor protein involved in Fe transport|nr:TonB-dependent receptor plug domain-containing protein [Opitutaceae bacterium]
MIAAASFARAQTAPDASAQAASPAAPAAPSVQQAAPGAPATTTNKAGETVVLSPFEVVSDSKGYYSATTESGTRINSKLSDLGSSIQVVSKQEMNDFAMLDINDVFMYTANAMGANTFLSNTIDRNGSVSDANQLNHTQANLVRGIAPANQSRDNFDLMGRTPIDPINVDAVEITRGPNATVFGLGQPSGTVNEVAAKANLSKDFTTVQVRGDSQGGWRTSLDLNRALRDNLAIRVAGDFEHDGFQRKPSGLDTARYNGMLTYKPFPWTTLHVEYEEYRESGNRPNSAQPRDSVSYWLSQGSPTWDPVTQTITRGGTLVNNTGTATTTTTFPTATGLPDVFTGTFTGSTHSIAFIDQNGLGYWSEPTTYSNSNGPFTGSQGDRYLTASPGAGTALGKFTSQPLFSTTPAVFNKALYDYSKVNIAAVNREANQDITSEATLDQVFFDTPLQSLTGQVGFFREDSKRYTRNIIGIANSNGQSGQLLIDVNQRNLDGTPNPYFLRPYFGQDDPETTLAPAKWDTYRAQIAYKLDFTSQKGWIKWLGLHNITAYDEYKYQINRAYQFKDGVSTPEPWIPNNPQTGTPLPRVNQHTTLNAAGATVYGAALNASRVYFRYYVGGNSGSAAIQNAPSPFTYGNYPLVWGNATTNVFNRAPTGLSQLIASDDTGGGANLKTILKTDGALIQSHFFDDSLVTNLGEREDKQYQTTGAVPQLLNADSETLNYSSVNAWAPGWKANSGKTDQYGYVVRPFKEIPFLQRGAAQGGIAGYLEGALLNTSVFLNNSNSFIPSNFATNDFLQPLTNPTGTDKEYGLEIQSPDGKLDFRINHYETVAINSRNGDAGTIAQRVTRIDIASTADFLLFNQATDWVQNTHPGFSTDQVNTEVANEMGLPFPTIIGVLQGFNNGTISSTNNINAVGTEAALNYNPTRFWTLQASFTQTGSFNSNVSQDVQGWIAARMPIWTTIIDQNTGQLWWTHNYGGSQTAQQNYLSFVQAPFSIIQQTQGKRNPQIPEYSSYLLSSIGLAQFTANPIISKFTLGGAIRWQSASSLGYYGLQQLPNVITALDPNKPIWYKQPAGVDAFISYSTRLWGGKVPTKIQLNARDLENHNSWLRPVATFPDGTPTQWAIVDPTLWTLTVTFNL